MQSWYAISTWDMKTKHEVKMPVKKELRFNSSSSWKQRDCLIKKIQVDNFFLLCNSDVKNCVRLKPNKAKMQLWLKDVPRFLCARRKGKLTWIIARFVVEDFCCNFFPLFWSNFFVRLFNESKRHNFFCTKRNAQDVTQNYCLTIEPTFLQSSLEMKFNLSSKTVSLRLTN